MADPVEPEDKGQPKPRIFASAAGHDGEYFAITDAPDAANWSAVVAGSRGAGEQAKTRTAP